MLTGEGVRDECSQTETTVSSFTLGPAPSVILSPKQVVSFLVTTTKEIQGGLTLFLLHCHFNIFNLEVPLSSVRLTRKRYTFVLGYQKAGTLG